MKRPCTRCGREREVQEMRYRRLQALGLPYRCNDCKKRQQYDFDEADLILTGGRWVNDGGVQRWVSS